MQYLSCTFQLICNIFSGKCCTIAAVWLVAMRIYNTRTDMDAPWKHVMCFRPTEPAPSPFFPPYYPVVAVGSPMMTALVDSAQMQAARFVAGGDLSGVLASTSLASTLQGIPANIPLHQVVSNAAAIDFNSPLQQSRGVYSTPSALDPQNIVSVLREQPRLTEDLDAIAALGDVTADPQSLRFNYSADSPVSRPSRQKKANFVYREQDRFVPINNVSRVMRKAIPRNGKVSKDAKECMQECVSEFISFLTSEASDRCIDEKRKTITGDDILFALSTLGFDNYVHPLQSYLKKYREYLKEDKQHGAARHDEEEVAENGDHHTSTALPSSDEQLTTTSTATQHDMPT